MSRASIFLPRTVAPVPVPRQLGFRDSAAADHLDFVRGMAAVAVLIYHIRYRFFFDYSDLVNPSFGAKIFYALTSFGHDAVMVFFVLSGFLIAGSVRSAIKRGQWSWTHYLENRFIRLYLVLIPALLLTFVWDRVGIAIFNDHPIYTGEAQTWKHDFINVNETLTLRTAVGNGLFLQTIYCPPFGTNAALWSLSYEFWYYLLFPLGIAAIGFRGIGVWQRLGSIALLLLVVTIMSRDMLLYFPLWLLGGVVGCLPAIDIIKRHCGLALTIATVLFVAVAMTTHIGSIKALIAGQVLVIDYINGCSFAILLWMLLHDVRGSSPSLYRGIARTLSNMSYSLYLAHLPLLAFARAWLAPNAPWTPNWATFGMFCGLTITAIVYSWLLSRLTEANTAHVRNAWSRGISLLKRDRLGLADV